MPRVVGGSLHAFSFGKRIRVSLAPFARMQSARVFRVRGCFPGLQSSQEKSPNERSVSMVQDMLDTFGYIVM